MEWKLYKSSAIKKFDLHDKMMAHKVVNPAIFTKSTKELRGEELRQRAGGIGQCC